ncbi:MAG TPA: hypothetical protein VLT91_10000 [Rhizomicrobium sp.]|nr:hypothetical protein [Rhizomicrobium sp.]
MLRMILMRLPVVFAGFLLALLFHSHVVSNHTARDGAENGVMMQQMASHGADGSTLQATFGLSGRNARQRKAGGDRRYHDMFHLKAPNIQKQLGTG